MGLNSSITKRLLATVGLDDKLFKLKLSNINLGEKDLVDSLCRIISGPPVGEVTEESQEDTAINSKGR